MIEKTILRELNESLSQVKRYKAKKNQAMVDYYAGAYDAFVFLLKELSPEEYENLKFSFDFNGNDYEL